MDKKYTALWELPIYDENNNESYSKTDSKQFDDFNEAKAWLGDKNTDINYYCMIISNITGRIVHVGCLA